MRRPLLQSLAALAIAALFVAPVAAVEPGGAGKETLKGTLDVIIVESFKETQPRFRYELRTADGQVPLEFADGGPEGLEGSRVEVTGKRIGKKLHVASSRPGRDLKVVAQGNGAGARRPADDRWPGRHDDRGRRVHDGRQRDQEPGRDPHQLQGQHRAAVHEEHRPDGHDRQRDEREEVLSRRTSKGRWALNATVYGWYTINATSTSCNWSDWATLGGNAATAAGVNLASFTNQMYIVPQTSTRAAGPASRMSTARSRCSTATTASR